MIAYVSPKIVSRRVPATLAGLIALASLLFAFSARCQDAAESSPAQPAEVVKSAQTEEDSQAKLTARLDQLKEASDEEVPNRQRLIELVRETLAEQKAAQQFARQAAEFEEARQTLPEKIAAVHQRLAAEPNTAENLAIELTDASLAELEERVATLEEARETAEKTRAQYEAESQRRAARRIELAKLVSQRQETAEKLRKTLAAETAEKESDELARAHRELNAAKLQAVEAEIEACDRELATLDSTSAEFVMLRRAEAEQHVAQLTSHLTQIQKLVATRRRDEAERQADEANWAAATAEPAVRLVADTNAALADERRALTGKLEQLAAVAQHIDGRLAHVHDQAQRVEEKVSAAGLTTAIGQLLRKQQAEIAECKILAAGPADHQDEIAAVQLLLFEREEQLADLRDLDARAADIVAALPKSCPLDQARLRELLVSQRELLESLVQDYNAYFAALVDLDTTQRTLLTEAAAFRQFIDERVLWIRSSGPISTADLAPAGTAFAWTLAPQHWNEVGTSLMHDVAAHPLPALFSGLLFAAWLFVQSKLRRHIHDLAQPTSNRRQSSLSRAWHTAAATLLISALWPAVLWCVGWRLSQASGGFATVLGQALKIAAGVLLPVLLARQICRRDGLAEAHFGWPVPVVRSLRKHFGWLVALGTPLVAWVSLLEAQATDAWKASLGRAMFVIGMLLLAGFVQRLLRRPQGPAYQLLVRRRTGWLVTLAAPIGLLAVALPLSLAVLSAAGWHFTALRLAWRLHATVWLVLVVVVLQALVVRWIASLYRRLAIDTALANTAVASPFAGKSTLSIGSALPPPEIDLEASDAQTKRLVNSAAAISLLVGLGLVWLDVLPALGIFNHLTLWFDADRNAAVTLANIVQAAALATLTVVAAANLPGLFDLLILQRLPIDHGLRYASVSLTRYFLVIAGMVWAFSAIGVGWSKVQWLAAAVTVGLGFGLQEIFANFISGLIVLCERPIRVGDTITVGDITGQVSRIQMRATTIVDWDRKELIVPNKEFITGRLVNWTLTDPVVRAIVRVGIAYGSDVALAEKLLLRVAADTPSVLPAPVPRALFVGFGESSLDFELRVFVGSIVDFVSVRHELNSRIDSYFRDAGIEIAFPQRDLHIRGVDLSPIMGGISQQISSALEEKRHAA